MYDLSQISYTDLNSIIILQALHCLRTETKQWLRLGNMTSDDKTVKQVNDHSALDMNH